MLDFTSWTNLTDYIMEQTKVRPYSSNGIHINMIHQTAILRAADGTQWYANDLNDPNVIEYSLYGQNGDQDENESRHNRPLLNNMNHIYLYRVRNDINLPKYLWYGKYKIIGRTTRQHPGRNGVMRNIIVLILEKINI